MKANKFTIIFFGMILLSAIMIIFVSMNVKAQSGEYVETFEDDTPGQNPSADFYTFTTGNAPVQSSGGNPGQYTRLGGECCGSTSRDIFYFNGLNLCENTIQVDLKAGPNQFTSSSFGYLIYFSNNNPGSGSFGNPVQGMGVRLFSSDDAYYLQVAVDGSTGATLGASIPYDNSVWNRFKFYDFDCDFTDGMKGFTLDFINEVSTLQTYVISAPRNVPTPLLYMQSGEEASFSATWGDDLRLDNLIINPVPDINETAGIEPAEFDRGLINTIHGLGFKTINSEMLFSIILVGFATVITAMMLRIFGNGSGKVWIIHSAAALMGIFCVLLLILKLWIFVLAIVLGTAMGRGGREFVDTFKSLARQPLKRRIPSTRSMSQKSGERQKPFDVITITDLTKNLQEKDDEMILATQEGTGLELAGDVSSESDVSEIGDVGSEVEESGIQESTGLDEAGDSSDSGDSSSDDSGDSGSSGDSGGDGE